ncbi:MAG TPA: serine protease [Kofleriaceae bacterium]|nr:serine protease [Kofleriaceae bacterium]
MLVPSVVRIFATTQEPDYDCPWQSHTPETATGSGVVIAPGRVLTGAHVVANATFLQVQKLSSPDKAVGRIAAICHDSDLALVEIDDPAFMTGVVPASLGELPSLRDRVQVVGFPVGGEEISITEGVVSRVEVQRYSHSQRHLLAVTVDAAINKGASGGPVMKDGHVCGIAFQVLSGADNIGEVVPAPLIAHFLAAADNATRRGLGLGTVIEIPGLGIGTQPLDNPMLRARVGLADGHTGVLVLSVEYDGSAWGHLRPGDALLAIDGRAIANNGTVMYQDRYRTRFDVSLGHRLIGDSVEVTILRDGAQRRLSFPLKPLRHLVPRSQYGTSPSYFVYGGLVFQPLSRDFLATWDTWWEKAPKEFLHLYYSGARSPERQEVVVLSQILADEVNVGYGDLYSESVVSINGRRPRDMLSFVREAEAQAETVEIVTSSDALIVLDAAAARAANERILSRYRITSDRSPDLEPFARPIAIRA